MSLPGLLLAAFEILAQRRREPLSFVVVGLAHDTTANIPAASRQAG